jgi:hypothetical protein
MVRSSRKNKVLLSQKQKALVVVRTVDITDQLDALIHSGTL